MGIGIALALALALVPACLDSPSGAADGGPDALPGCPSAGLLFDDFDEERPELWQEFGADDCQLRIASSRLEVDDAGASCGLATSGCYDMTDRWIEVDAALPGPGLVFAVHLNDFGDDLVVSVNEDGELALRHVDPAGVATTLSALPFDPDVHQLWRVWHSATGNEVYFETSRRAVPSWARLAELWLDGVSVRKVQVRLGASGSAGMVGFGSLHGVEL